MAKITTKDVEYVAKLAKLILAREEITKFQKQLSSVVDYISQLSEVDTANLEPTSQTTGLESVYREDKVTTAEQLSCDEALSGTDKAHNGYFVVDAVLNKET